MKHHPLFRMCTVLLCFVLFLGCKAEDKKEESVKTCSDAFNRLSLANQTYDELLNSPSRVTAFIREQEDEIEEETQKLEEEKRLADFFSASYRVKQKDLSVAIVLRDLALDLQKVSQDWEQEAIVEEMNQLKWSLKYDDTKVFSSQDCMLQLPIHNSHELSLEEQSRLWNSDNLYVGPRIDAQTDLGQAYENSQIRSDLESIEFQYEHFKTSLGVNVGFEVSDSQQRLWKVKLAFESDEVHEPMAARMFWALGYHVDEPYYVKNFKVLYQDRIQSDFKNFSQSIKSLAPFVSGIIRPDGTHLDWSTQSKDAIKGLLGEEEGQIHAYIFKEVVVEQRDAENVVRVGPWFIDFHNLKDRRAARTLGIFMPWMGSYDLIYDNFRIVLARQSSGFQTKLVLHDLGRSFALGQMALNIQEKNGSYQLDFPLPIGHHYDAFHRIRLDDAQWAGQQMSLFSQSQLVQAAQASGYDLTQSEAIAEKLISLRNQFNTLIQ